MNATRGGTDVGHITQADDGVNAGLTNVSQNGF
jgi:hypothetical protein